MSGLPIDPRRPEFYTPGEPLPEGNKRDEAEFDRLFDVPDDLRDHWVWAAITGLLESPTVPRGASEWIWQCAWVLQPARFIEILAEVLPEGAEGDTYEIVLADVLWPLADAFPPIEESMRRFRLLAERAGHVVWTEEHEAWVRDVYTTAAAIQELRGRPTWVVHRKRVETRWRRVSPR